MLPIFFEIPPCTLFGWQIGPFALHSYGLFIAAAFMMAIAWSMREARQRGLDAYLLSDLGFYVILGAILGARILYVLINPTYFSQHPAEMFMFWKGGLVFSGGAILATIFAVQFLKAKQQDIWIWLDTVVPGIALGEAIGRLGCLSAGCCYGAACDLPWAIMFQDPDSLAPLNVPLHPTQIYHSLAGLFCFVFALLIKSKIRHTGWLMGIFLIQFGLFRFVIELYRADYRGDFGPVSVTQVIALGAVALGCFIIYLRRTHVSR